MNSFGRNETKKLWKVLSPVLIIALVLGGIFVPAKKVKAAPEDYQVVIRIANATGTIYEQGFAFRAVSQTGFYYDFEIPADTFINYPVKDGKIGTALAASSELLSGYDRIFKSGAAFTGVNFPYSSAYNFSVSTTEFDATTHICYLDYEIVYRNYPTYLNVYAPLSGTDDYVVAPAALKEIKKTDSSYDGLFEVTLSSELEPEMPVLSEFDGKWKGLDGTVVLQNGVTGTVRIPLTNLLPLQDAENSGYSLTLTPVYKDSIVLPINYEAAYEGATETVLGNVSINNESSYSETKTSTSFNENTGNYSVSVTMPSVTPTTSGYTFNGWRIETDVWSDMHISATVTRGVDAGPTAITGEMVINAGETITVYIPRETAESDEYTLYAYASYEPIPHTPELTIYFSGENPTFNIERTFTATSVVPQDGYYRYQVEMYSKSDDYVRYWSNVLNGQNSHNFTVQSGTENATFSLINVTGEILGGSTITLEANITEDTTVTWSSILGKGLINGTGDYDLNYYEAYLAAGNWKVGGDGFDYHVDSGSTARIYGPTTSSVRFTKLP